MAFKIQVTGLDELSGHQFITEVVIERSIYEHSRAHITVQWDEHERYGERRTAFLAAKALNCPVQIEWKDNDLAESVPCYQGYVERVSGKRNASHSHLILDCVTVSKRTDLVPRHRAFQACKLLDICRHIAKTEPLIKIENSGDLDFDIPLSVQYGETDYAYLSRMLHAWGIPMAVSAKSGEVLLGARGTASSGKFPDVGFGWSEVVFCGQVDYFAQRKGGGSGPTGNARKQVDALNGQLKPKAADYFPGVDAGEIHKRVSAVESQVDTAAYHLRLESAVLPYDPGEVVKFENQDHLLRCVRIVGHPREATAFQEFELQPFTLPYQPGRRVPVWTGRALWAHVTDNEKDPMQSGRVQVQFEWEKLDKLPGDDKVWLPTVTPYGGGKSPSDGKAGEYNGFYALPEVGERVLVQFLGDWDAEAVVLGTVREKAVNPMYNAKHTKRWRTPSGNEVTLTTKDGTEVVRLRCKDKIFFESKIQGANASVYITPGESDADRIHFQKGAGPPRLDIECAGQINVKAGMKLHLEGQQVQIKASAGNVNIDGAPNVMINCVPLPMIPLQTQKFEEVMMSTSTKPRKLPTPPETTAAASAAATAQQDEKKEEKPKTWIEIVLKDGAGNPVPGERYRLKLPDGRTVDGRLNSEGKARVNGIEPGSAQVSFPDIDANEWKTA